MKRLLVGISLIITSGAWAQGAQVTGRVFEDTNQNRQYDKGEPLLKDVLISNGKDLVVTNAKGEYKINSLEQGQIFLIKPSGYQSPLSKSNKVEFYIPFGEEHKSYDFPVYKQEEDKSLKAVLLGDLQSDVMDDIHHVEKLVVSELATTPPDLIFPLGDLAFDRLEVFEPLSQALGVIGSPIYYVVGNHDLNFGSGLTLQDRDSSYKKAFGPSYYALEYGEELILVLNNILPVNDKEYIGTIDEVQKAFIQNVLARYALKYDKVKVMMHIPIEFMEDKQEFLDLFKDYKEVFVAVGHTHTQYHQYFERDNKKPVHQLVAGAVCGAWWQGPHDIEGIPFAMMYDGTWKGYWTLETQKGDYNLSYKVSGRAENKQIQIWTPEVQEWDKSLEHLNDGYVYANVFAADLNTAVEISFDGVSWQKMKYYEGVDPHYTRLIELQNQGRYKNMKTSPLVDAKRKSKHLWRMPIPKGLKEGPQLIKVKAIDPRYGLNHVENRVLWTPK
ncbi:calcineurin-like phosphoesterase C-terminal domain-containing protein [Myroides sp. C4067]|uniref:calcineurin-like phosphoesterase C-terminal domain-containing protein n=1 Tax=Myroides sp. C4067 TaxID=3136765 RepID=UPI0031014B88